MRNIFKSFTQAIKDKDGATAVEYAILLALITAAVILSVGSLGQNTRDAFNTLNYDWSNPAVSEEDKCKDSPDDEDCGIGND